MGLGKKNRVGLVVVWYGFGFGILGCENNKDPFGFLVTNHKDQNCNFVKVKGLSL